MRAIKKGRSRDVIFIGEEPGARAPIDIINFPVVRVTNYLSPIVGTCNVRGTMFSTHNRLQGTLGGGDAISRSFRENTRTREGNVKGQV